MNIDGVHYRSIWLGADGWSVDIIDQTQLPHDFKIVRLTSLEQAAQAIRTMQIRGAPLIGATSAYGLCLALRESTSDSALDAAIKTLIATRPTAINLAWALQKMRRTLLPLLPDDRISAAYSMAASLCDEDVATNEIIGRHGRALIQEIAAKKSNQTVNILTHCNAGWLATVDWGTAMAPIYQAHAAGLPVHVWVDETRPRNQGARLTACELGWAGIPHTIIVDNAGGHLMQQGRVDLCLVGTDRTSRTGDVCNKIGTYLKALAAHDTGIPFYVALPSSTIDWTITEAFRQIPIEERTDSEVSHIIGKLPETGLQAQICLTPEASAVANPAFDITPARLISGFITERGICSANEAGLVERFPEKGNKD